MKVPSKDASVPVGMKKNDTTGVEGGRELGDKGNEREGSMICFCWGKRMQGLSATRKNGIR